MADPGFPRGGGANSPGGAPTYDFAKNSPKLHEIERIWAPRGGARPKFYYVDPSLSMKGLSSVFFTWLQSAALCKTVCPSFTLIFTSAPASISSL